MRSSHRFIKHSVNASDRAAGQPFSHDLVSLTSQCIIQLLNIFPCDIGADPFSGYALVPLHAVLVDVGCVFNCDELLTHRLCDMFYHPLNECSLGCRHAVAHPKCRKTGLGVSLYSLDSDISSTSAAVRLHSAGEAGSAPHRSRPECGHGDRFAPPTALEGGDLPGRWPAAQRYRWCQIPELRCFHRLEGIAAEVRESTHTSRRCSI